MCHSFILDISLDDIELNRGKKRGALRQLPKLSGGHFFEKQRGVETVAIELQGGYGVMNLFQERGSYSNQVYAPTVNHRQVEFKGMMNVTTDTYGKPKIPLISSMLNRTDENDFSTKERPCILFYICLLYTSPSPRDQRGSRMPSSA